MEELKRKKAELEKESEHVASLMHKLSFFELTLNQLESYKAQVAQLTQAQRQLSAELEKKHKSSEQDLADLHTDNGRLKTAKQELEQTCIKLKEELDLVNMCLSERRKQSRNEQEKWDSMQRELQHRVRELLEHKETLQRQLDEQRRVSSGLSVQVKTLEEDNAKLQGTLKVQNLKQEEIDKVHYILSHCGNSCPEGRFFFPASARPTGT